MLTESKGRDRAKLLRKWHVKPGSRPWVRVVVGVAFQVLGALGAKAEGTWHFPGMAINPVGGRGRGRTGAKGGLTADYKSPRVTRLLSLGY